MIAFALSHSLVVYRYLWPPPLYDPSRGPPERFDPSDWKSIRQVAPVLTSRMAAGSYSYLRAARAGSGAAPAVTMSIGDWRSPRSATGYHLDHKDGPAGPGSDYRWKREL